MRTVEPIVSNRRGVALDERMASLADLYRFDDREAVTGLLYRHDFLVELLIEARKHIRTHFGPDTPVVLEVFIDSEELHGKPQLFALVETALPPEEALSLLDCLDETWWLEAASRGRTILHIDIRLV